MSSKIGKWTQAPEYGPIRSKASARNRAAALIERLAIPAPQAGGRGIDVKGVAENLGAKIIAAPNVNDKLYGALVFKNDVPIILYNEGHAEVHQRFIIAHEIGHLLFHSGGRDAPMFREDSGSKGVNIPDIQANAFAASLLMPELFVAAHVVEPIAMYDAQPIEALAVLFNVSMSVMTLRLHELGLLAAS